ncbi:carbon-monoxide dehydrogenase small subunit [Salinihabitans flavidus]|uniref:Carbon-monoxide dehydrogenase small subunit n=1 Tax=Salinihabitans flavidus TaxID=569882 RepID=A0A1H8UMT5_9RHOB|nr:(2Fe-2S)-binding protein [Salinihabitans flavidus]SEP04293.1 carbon-monoxide dehydrogenase small subunit [Salinihabitans flavidus]
MSGKRISLIVNGESVKAEVLVNRLLSDFLRDDLALTGTKRGCETGVCGACSVLVDGDVVKSCLSLAAQVDGKTLTTVEGLGRIGDLHPLQESFMAHGGLQCGYCTPGFLLAAADLLSRNPDPQDAEIREALSGNLCRCTGYQGIVDAVRNVAESTHGN